MVTFVEKRKKKGEKISSISRQNLIVSLSESIFTGGFRHAQLAPTWRGFPKVLMLEQNSAEAFNFMWAF